MPTAFKGLSRNKDDGNLYSVVIDDKRSRIHYKEDGSVVRPRRGCGAIMLFSSQLDADEFGTETWEVEYTPVNVSEVHRIAKIPHFDKDMHIFYKMEICNTEIASLEWVASYGEVITASSVRLIRRIER